MGPRACGVLVVAVMLVSPRWAKAQDLGEIHRAFIAAHDAGRAPEAERLARQGVKLSEARRDGLGVATFTALLGVVLHEQDKYKESETVNRRAAELWERREGPNDKRVADILLLLGIAVQSQGRNAEAERTFRRALEIEEMSPDPGPGSVAALCRLLSQALEGQGKLEEAETFARKDVALRRRDGGSNGRALVGSLTQLAGIVKSRDRLREAEALYKQALAVGEKDPDAETARGGATPPIVAVLANLSSLYLDTGRYEEADTTLQRSRAILLRTKGPDAAEMAAIHSKLGALAMRRGRYADAEREYKAQMAIVERLWGVDHPEMAMALESLSLADQEQNRYAEAEPKLRRALNLREKYDGPDRLPAAVTRIQLADVLCMVGRAQEAERLAQRSLAVLEESLGPHHMRVGSALASLGRALEEQNRLDEAEAAYLKAVAVDERNGHINPWSGPGAQAAVAGVRIRQGHWDQALVMLDSVIPTLERLGAPPHQRANLLERRAYALWRQGKTADALAEVSRAVELYDQQNADNSGAERERAASLGHARTAFELMVAIQTGLEPDRCDVAAVFETTERAHARTLLDELNLAGTDLTSGLPAADRARLRARETRLKSDIRQLEVKLMGVRGKDDARAAPLAAELARARASLYAHDRDVRNDSPVYRSLLSRRGSLPTLAEIQKTVLRPGDLMLVYYFGNVVGVTLAVDRDSARVWRPAFDAGQAEALGVEAAEVTADLLRRALVNAARTGVAQRLGDPKGEIPVDGLAALADALIPAEVRKGLTDGTVKRLFVVPDGPLALLPFEALVMERKGDHKYLLDVGPPVAYVPSAAVFKRLTERHPAEPVTGRESVLALGDPSYPAADRSNRVDEARGPIGGPSRYSLAGGTLPRLPFSGWEAQWVAKAFRDAGADALALTGAAATEAGVRSRAPGRKIVHLACHGIVDQELGNFHGGLALAPGPRADDTADDGFLALNEIHTLDLSRCELAILSACETNLSPGQKGEGTFTLSRGFLVAGARRVLASDWLVDDEAAASLVSVYCTLLAKAEKEGKPVDYASALREAKRWVRKQEKWGAPYYWGALVLVGPG